jgi:archaellum biogenesis ATPase FlaH
MTKWQEWKSGLHIGKNPCFKCRKNGNDSSGNNFHYYGESLGGYCYACGCTILSDSQKALRGIEEQDEEEFELVGKEFSKEIFNNLRKVTSTDSKGFRGLKKEVTKLFGVFHEFDTGDGGVLKQYYPCTINAELSGVKVRIVPKVFDSYGETGKECDPFGWVRFKTQVGKYCVVAAGEIDCMSAFQMLKEYTDGKGQSEYGYIPCVSSTIGENSISQLKDKYSWFDGFERIIIAADADEAGLKAAEKLAKSLPKGKVYIMQMVLKDTNEYLVAGKQKEWVNLFFKAKQYTPSGIVGSGSLMDKIVDYVQIPKIPLPPFMHKLQNLMAGGIPLGVITVLGSSSGSGKSTIVDECCYYWYFNSPHKVGVVTLEADSAMYGINILSRHLKRKINLIESVEEKVRFLQDPEVVEASDKLWFDAKGNQRFYLVEDRDGTIEEMKSLISNLVVACDCKVIVLDPVSDILEGCNNEEQANFMKWLKGMVKSHLVTFFLISHVRKNATGSKANSTGSELHEEDFMGSSSVFKSSACNLLFMRDKEDPDDFNRNCTRMKVTKIRWTGKTSPCAGEYYYDNETHQVFDKSDWLEKHPVEV